MASSHSDLDRCMVVFQRSMKMRKIVILCFAVGVAILVHHLWLHGTLFDVSNILCHEFFACLFIGIALGGLIL